jgi:predicted house-cleaning noncanonical NTP pyrophosphatase (MazG superfamily)
VVEKIWAIILEVVAVIAESIGANEDDMIMQVIENNKRLRALQAYAESA